MNKSSFITYMGMQPASKCGYCNSENNISRGMWAYQLNCTDYQNLIDMGWRRCGNYIYLPTNNKTCCPQYTIRCDVKKNLSVTPDKSQRQVIRKLIKYLKIGRNETSDRRDDISIDTENLQEITSIQKTTNRQAPIQGQGLDASKGPCVKSKLRRMEKYKAKQINASLSNSPSKKKPIPHSQTLKEMFAEVKKSCDKHTFEVRTLKADLQDEIFMKTHEECYQVYRDYQINVHKDDPDKIKEKSYIRFLIDNKLIYQNTCSFVKHVSTPDEPVSPDVLTGDYGLHHQLYIIDGKVVAVGVLDVLPRCVSSVYFYYDTKFSFLSLGTLSTLREILWTDSLTDHIYPDIQHYYMGFYIHLCPKMKYKGKYTGSSLLCSETHRWYPIQQCLEKLEHSVYTRFANNDESISQLKTLEHIKKSIYTLYNSQLMNLSQYFQGTLDLEDNIEEQEDMILEYVNIVGESTAMSMRLIFQ